MESLGYYCCFLYVEDIVCGRMNGWCKLWTGGVVGERKKNIHVQIDSPLLKLLKQLGL